MFITDCRRALAILSAAAFSLSGCSSLAYHPSDVMFAPHPERLDEIREELTIESLDQTPLSAWYLKARAGGQRGAVLQFQGNAQNMTAHFQSLAWLIDEGYDLLIHMIQSEDKRKPTADLPTRC
jgi:hypothetical protein